MQMHDVALGQVRVLLCDADGNLFPSEEPAFVASAVVTNAFLAEFGVPVELTADQLRLETTGKNFRGTALDLCVSHGVAMHPSLAQRHPGALTATAEEFRGRPVLTPAALERWVAEERRQVTAHLGAVLTPDPAVLDPLTKLAAHLTLVAVSSSATGRLDACFAATGLSALIPPDRRYSAEDSLPVPISKPDPAIYRFAAAQLGLHSSGASGRGLAVEDSAAGARSAVAAGLPTIGNVMFVLPAERAGRVEQLRDAGVAAVVLSWAELADLLLPLLGRS